MNNGFRKKIAVVGGGPAGLSAASKAKRERPSLEVTVFEKSNFISTSKCGIPYLISGGVKPEDLIRYKPEFFETERDIRIKTNREVLSIERSKGVINTLSTDTGNEESFPYDELILCTGSRPALPNISHLKQKDNLFSLRSIEEATRCLKFIDSRKPKSGIIIGCGFYGLELASALSTHGIKITILEGREKPLDKYPVEIQKRLIEEIEKSDLVLKTAVRITEAFGDKEIEYLLTDEGEESADFYFVAAGVEPNSVLADEAGLELSDDRAVIVDQFQRSSEFNILAAGDVSTVRCIITGDYINFPTAALANKTGYFAGLNAAGYKKRFPGTVRTVLSKFNNLRFGSVGLPSSSAGLMGYDIVESTVTAPNRQYYLDNEEIILHLIANRKNAGLLGAQVASYGDITAVIDTLAAALHSGTDVEQLATLDLCYHPAQSNDYSPIHYAARKIIKKL